MLENAKSTRRIEFTSRACEWYVNRVNGGIIQGTGTNVWTYHLSTKRDIGGGPIGVQVSEILRVDNTVEFLESGRWRNVAKTALVIFTNENFLSLKVQMIAAEVNFLHFYTLPQKMTNLSSKQLEVRDELTSEYLHQHNTVMNGWIQRVCELAQKAGHSIDSDKIDSFRSKILSREISLEPEMEEMILQTIESYKESVGKVWTLRLRVYDFERQIKEMNCKFIGINDTSRF